MGRKKRKTGDDGPEETLSQDPAPPMIDPRTVSTTASLQPVAVKVGSSNGGGDNGLAVAVGDGSDDKDKGKGPTSSGYAMTSHSGEIIDEDIYVSEGSDDGEEDDEVEMVLMGSRMGMMRRGIHHTMLVQPNRQWVRQDATTAEGGPAGGGGGEGGDDDLANKEDAEQRRLREQEEELAKLDPAQRAARLLIEKQRKLEEAKEAARRLESEENAGRDPCLFSKRTAFDIRFDQIDDKPWVRGAGDLTDFFNYGLLEEDWLEYSQQQLMIRQELTDASRQRRPPDPTIVPVTPRTPNKQTPKVAVAASSISGDENGDDGGGVAADDVPEVLGPVLVKPEDTENNISDGTSNMEASQVEKSEGPNKAAKAIDVPLGIGGAWGGPPGSVLAQLIEEQEAKNKEEAVRDTPSNMKVVPSDSTYGGGGGGGGGGQTNRRHYDEHHRDGKPQQYGNSGQDDWSTHSSIPNQQGHHHQQDWNNPYGGHHDDWGGYQQQQFGGPPVGPPPESWNYRGGGGRGGGRGGFNPHFAGRGGRGDGGGGPGGRGGYNPYGGGRGRGGGRGPYPPPRDLQQPPPPPPPWGGGGGGGGGGDYQGRKRGREDYDNRGGGGGGGGGRRRR